MSHLLPKKLNQIESNCRLILIIYTKVNIYEFEYAIALYKSYTINLISDNLLHDDNKEILADNLRYRIDFNWLIADP